MKSHVTMEQHVCIICGNTFDTGSILLDKKLRAKFEAHTITGNSICGKCQPLLDDNYIALIGVTNKGDSLKLKEANCTGDLSFIKRKVFNQIFDVEIKDLPMVFVEPEVVKMIKNLKTESTENANATN